MSEAAVYRMYDQAGVLLYVGCSVQWPVRISQHGGKPWWPEVASVKVEHFASKREALDAEGRAQVDENPVHNVVRGGRYEEMAARRREIKEQREARWDAEAADRRARGVYEAFFDCLNCRRSRERVEVPMGTLVSDYVCQRCGVSNATVQEAQAAC